MDLTPAVYEHAAALIGESPWRVSRNADLLARGHAEAYRVYRHRPVVVGIDIYNLEAEAHGGRVHEPAGNGIPAVVERRCQSVEELADLPPLDVTAGRIPMVLAVGRQLARQLPQAEVRIPVSGPFSIAANLMGMEALAMAAATRPEATRAALEHLAAGQVAFCQAVSDAALDVAFFESAATPPILSPKLFREVELPALKRLLRQGEEVLGRSLPCIMGGNTAPILEDLLSTGTRYVICPAAGETDQSAFMAKMTARPDVRVRVNMDSGAIARGPWTAIRGELDRILALIGGRENTCIGTGVLPYETPSENVLAAQRYVREK